MGMENQQVTKDELDKLSQTYPSPGSSQGAKTAIIIAGVVAAIIIIGLIVGLFFLVRAGPAVTAQVRDVFIIVMALVSLLLMFVLVILVVQLARLINLLQNEIKPILESTNETVNTLRGTTTFLSDNLVQPVIKLNEYFAAFSRTMGMLNLVRKREKKINHSKQEGV